MWLFPHKPDVRVWVSAIVKTRAAHFFLWIDIFDVSDDKKVAI
jgi:hypothetical protein